MHFVEHSVGPKNNRYQRLFCSPKCLMRKNRMAFAQIVARQYVLFAVLLKPAALSANKPYEGISA